MKKITRLAVSACTAIASLTALSMTVFAEGEAAAASAGTATPSTGGSLLYTVIMFGGMLLLFYLILIRPQSKRDKEAQAMRDNVRVGDEICTAGGLVGIVIKITEDTVVIETGGERSKIRVKKWAIHENITQMEEAQAAEKARKAARQKGIAAAGVTTDDKPKKSEKKEKSEKKG